MVFLAGLTLGLWALPQSTLADRLVAASSDEQLTRLLEGAGSSVNADLLAVLQKRADAEFAAYRFAAAQPIYRALLAAARRLNDASSSARALWNLGRCLARLGKNAEAIDLYRQSLAVSTAAQLDSISALTLRSLSAANQALNNFPEAIEAAQRSLEIYGGLDDKTGMSGATFALANDYFAMGEYRRAAESYEICLKIAESIQNDQMIDQTLKNLGSLYSEQGDYEVALAYMERVMHGKVFQQGEKSSVATTLNILGALYRRLGRYNEALATVERALPLARETGDQRQFRTCSPRVEPPFTSCAATGRPSPIFWHAQRPPPKPTNRGPNFTP